MLDGGGEVGGQAEVGKVRRAIVDVDCTDADAQRLVAAGRRLGFRLGTGWRGGRLRDQQVVDVGGAVFVDHEARIRLLQADLADAQCITVTVGQPVKVELLPFDEVAILDGVQGMQLVDLRLAVNAEGQRINVAEVDVEVTAKHAAAQLQADVRGDVGLGDAQVDVLGADLELGGNRRQVDFTGSLQLALLAHAGIELEGEGRLVEAVEVLQVEVQRAHVQRYRLFLRTIGQVHLVVAQLHILEQHLPGLAWLGRGRLRLAIRLGCSRFGFLLRRGLGRLAGEQLLPVELAIGFQRGPGFQFLAADLAYGYQLFGEIYRRFTDIQACQTRQWATIWRLDGKGRDAHRGVVEQQLGFLGQVQFVVGVETDDALFQYQRHGIADIGPEGFHLAFSDFQRAFGSDGYQAERSAPVDAAAVRADRHQGHVGAVFRQGAEVLQFQVHRIVEELDRFAGPQVLEVQEAFDELDAVDAQWERITGWRFGFRFAGRKFEQLCQVQFSILGEQQLGMRLFQLDARQVQGTGPQAVELKVGVQAFKADLLLVRLANLQAPEGQLKTEGVELDTLQVRRHRGVVGQLLVGDTQGNPWENQKAKQAVQGQSGQHGA
ncbi:hypothetical protein D3C80_743380 [compost metagenome]